MENSLKSYPPTWEGRLLLACRKCQKKLKADKGMCGLAKLKKTIKRHNRDHPAAALHVMNVPCFDLCPKGAVTICLLTNPKPTLSVLRNEDELEQLYRQGSGSPI